MTHDDPRTTRRAAADLALGLFVVPLHFPERPLADCWDDDLEMLVEADRLGFSEAWIGEHYCIRWENMPAPELLIAKALALTSRIRLGSGVHVVGYHHPAILAHKIAALDHLSRGRFMFGIGPGGTPSDFEMMGLEMKGAESRERMVEAIDMITALWDATEPSTREGRFWTLTVPAPNPKMSWQYHIRPYQAPHPPIAVAGTSPRSQTLRWGAARGYLPLSFFDLNVEILRSHRDVIAEGAREGGSAVAYRDWRIARVVYVAETDDEARRHVLESSMPRAFREYFRRVFFLVGGLGAVKHDPEVPDAAVDVGYMLDNAWIVGGPETVARRLEALYREVGGFGTLLVAHFDTHPHPERFLRSLALLREEVLPRLRLEGAAPPHAEAAAPTQPAGGTRA
ncbi:LLM class flavin-dependent oxidoreductase [Salinarimonas rosea]|uniref:LLM class flavin-dependent oxidoreductase n=1 Tax=Salinarimonas rosea TaxID=552063 RepID=UPI0004199BED|nr:LLM class flavin-dependent oxidoreductase [Salinarimonas rosea]